jgi:hypothetical protein
MCFGERSEDEGMGMGVDSLELPLLSHAHMRADVVGGATGAAAGVNGAASGESTVLTRSGGHHAKSQMATTVTGLMASAEIPLSHLHIYDDQAVSKFNEDFYFFKNKSMLY